MSTCLNCPGPSPSLQGMGWGSGEGGSKGQGKGGVPAWEGVGGVCVVGVM